MHKIMPILMAMIFVACKPEWNWQPNPYVGDSVSASIVNSDGNTLSCSAPAFDEMTCFSPEDIASLKANIENLNIDKKTKDYILTEIDYAIGKR